MRPCVPAYLIIVPLSLALDSPLMREVETALPVLEGIEQDANRAGIEVDARMERGPLAARRAGAALWEVETLIGSSCPQIPRAGTASRPPIWRGH